MPDILVDAWIEPLTLEVTHVIHLFILGLTGLAARWQAWRSLLVRGKLYLTRWLLYIIYNAQAQVLTQSPIVMFRGGSRDCAMLALRPV